MDVLVPYKSEQNTGELKFALRSIEKNLSGYNQIFIIGDKPKWLKNVIHIPARDYAGRKAYSIMQKTLKGCNDERLSNDFIFTNDDIYFLKPIDVTQIKYWYEGTLEDWLKKSSSGKYKIQIKNTMKLTSETFAYLDIHAPIVYNKLEARNVFHGIDSEYLIKSLYYRRACTITQVSEPMKDLKLNGHLPEKRIKELISGRLFFSTGNFSNQAERVLNELFPNKSKYEL